jgi:integral membrane protein
MSVAQAETGAGRPRADRMFGLFRLVALIEGVTTLVLFFVAMPIKYGLDNPSWVQLWGPIHGYAFVAYIGLMVLVLRGRGWGAGDWMRTTFASFVPFGTFLNDGFLKRRWAAGTGAG